MLLKKKKIVSFGFCLIKFHHISFYSNLEKKTVISYLCVVHIFASLASRDSLDSIDEVQLRSSPRGSTMLTRAANAFRASGSWRSSSMLLRVIILGCGMLSHCIGNFSISCPDLALIISNLMLTSKIITSLQSN